MKKLYSNTLMQLIVALCTFSFVACQEYSIDSQPEGPLNIQIDAQDSYTALATSPSNVVFNISSNTPWTIESDAQWCVPTPSMSASSSLVSEIVVSMENNTGKQSRTAKLTIKAEGISNTKVITIEQVSKEKLVVVPYGELVATEGEEIQFSIISNKPWEIIPSISYVSDIDKKSGNGNENGQEEIITVKIPANAGARREGTITVRTEFEEYSFTIIQNGITIVQEEDPANTTMAITNAGPSETTIKISSNKEWKVEVPKEYQSWLQAEAISDSELKLITTSYNPLFASRKGQVLIKTKEVIDGFDGITFDVEQQGKSFWWNGGGTAAQVQENGSIILSGTGTSQIVSNFTSKKGRLTIDLASLNLTGESWIELNYWPNIDWTSTPNFHLHLKPNKESNFTCGGGYNWTQKTFTMTTEECNAIRQIVAEVTYKPGSTDKLIIRLLFNGEEVAVLDNNIQDIYAFGDDNQYCPQTIYYRLQAGAEDSSMHVNSMTWEPIE
ncbi:Putative binding domain-containing protein, N-terminal [Bacteroides faecichinchillae]|uniref:Putative binding domain-containing protein, N-terminal n=1 Tax=Bacteroides faecichinchillae TaxID=871325 RepID=A0A1M4TH14_9BACE|nr:BACON domain-containing carbohydrate-binding protein [Bacteroides faecichinchillae]THG67977.1 hypothetical protein E5981_06855 [Bacteroides faecichinchillae]SHE43799.1 Putative binding domain-containing protein, N-terminal [Bacteroides faecichinchillae]